MSNPVYLGGRIYLYFPDSNCLINKEVKSVFLRHPKNICIDNITIDENVILCHIKKISQLVFEMTQECNLRCRYCVYGGAYSFRRTNHNKSMTFPIAKEALDLVYGLIKGRKKKEFTIGFYGGEPLIEYELMKRIVKYVMDLFAGWKLSYSMTTNATLLNRSMMDYFAVHGFGMNISLDGPATNHDAKRVYHDGKGSFLCVMDKLKMIKNRHESYYQKKVTFEAVYSKDLSLNNVYDFFSGDSLVNSIPVSLSNVNELYTDYYSLYPYNKKRYKDEYRKIGKKIFQKKRNNITLSPIEKRFLSWYSELWDDLSNDQYSCMFGSCLFDTRIFLDVYGRFHVCEKVNRKFPLGDVWNGFNFTKMARMAEAYIDIVEKNCMDCDVRFLCHRCYPHFMQDGVFGIPEGFCMYTRNRIITMMEDMVRLQEEGLLK